MSKSNPASCISGKHAGINDQEPPECFSFLQEAEKLRMDMASKADIQKRAEAVMAEAQIVRNKGVRTTSEYKGMLANLQRKREAVAFKSLEEGIQQVALWVRLLSAGLHYMHQDLPCGLQNVFRINGWLML